MDTQRLDSSVFYKILDFLSTSCKDILLNNLSFPLNFQGWQMKNQMGFLQQPWLTWHANHPMHHKLPYKKTAYGNTITFLFFFYGHSMESLSAINLYGQLNDFNVILYGHPMIVMIFWTFFFD